MSTPLPLPLPEPPQWLVDDVQNRAVLLLNHVLSQEPEATARLARHSGRVAALRWRSFSLTLVVTPAGLCDRASPVASADLTLEVTETSPVGLVQAVVRGEKPAVRLSGDVLFAAEINWLVDNLRWDIEEDLARLVGDAPAHTIADLARRAAAALRAFATGGGAARRSDGA